MYWADAGVDKVQKANLDGSSIEDVVTGVSPIGVALDIADGKVYWTDHETDKIQRANMDGTSIENLLDVGPSYNFPSGLAVTPEPTTLSLLGMPCC